MNSYIDSAIRDVAPTAPDPLPEALRQLTERYYASSRLKITLKQQEEVARYHICAIVAVNNRLEKLNLSAPTFNHVPLPTPLARNLVELFTSHLDGSRSTTGTPATTPKKRRQPNPPLMKSLTTTATPTKRGASDADNVFNTPSPSKKPRSAKASASKSKTPFTKKLEAAASGKGSSPTKKSPLKSSPSKSILKKIEMMSSTILTPRKKKGGVDGNGIEDAEEDLTFLQSPEKQFILLSSREITALCNKFQIEESTTKHIVEMFQQYYTKVTNEWVLICGLVLNCYFVMNHQSLTSQMGAKTATYKTMFNLQNGGLMLTDIRSSVGIVKPLIEYSRWFKKLKVQHNFLGDDSRGTSFSSNSMISPRYQFHSQENTRDHEEWVHSIKLEIFSRK